MKKSSWIVVAGLTFLILTIVGAVYWPDSVDNSPKLTQSHSESLATTDAGVDSGNREDESETGEDPRKPLINARVFPFGEIDVNAVKQARFQLTLARARSAGFSLPPGQWVQQGPLKTQGRVTDMVVDPSDENVVYVGAADGGIFKTTDGGDSWIPIFDDIPTMSIGSLALDPENPNVVFAGTGEANPSADSIPGSGLYKSIDGGQSWELLGLENAGRIGRIVVHPANSDIIHVAVSGYIWSPGPDRGVYRTTDGGQTWQRVLFVNEITGAIDIVQRNDNPDVLFAAMWEHNRSPGDRVVGGLGSGVFKSSDGGDSWERIENGLPPQSEIVGRIGLAISPTNPDVMVYVYALATGPLGGVYRTVDGGDNWAQVNDAGISDIHSSFGWWFGNVRIDPTDEETFWVLGLYKVRTTDGGNGFQVSSDGMHVDHHAMAFGSGNNPKIYAGNDGGVYSSTDGGLNFVKTSGDLPITAAYRVAIANWNDDALWLGTQDNGSLQDLKDDGVFNRILGGDGFEVIPYLKQSDRLWAQFQWGNVRYRDENGNWDNATDGLVGRRNWNAPHAQDPNDPETRYFGTNFVFRNNGNTSWQLISPDLTNGDQGTSTTFGTLTTIGVSPADSNIIWAGADDGSIHVTDDGGSNWNRVSEKLPERWVTSVRPHPTETDECLVTLSGFQWGEDIAHIYRTRNLGLTWTPVDGGIPDMPVNDVMYDPKNTDRYFAATDLGVYESFDEGENWELLGQGLPAVSVYDFAYRKNTRELVAGTHGRSILTLILPQVYADSAKIQQGKLIQGSAAELASSDDEYLSVQRNTTEIKELRFKITGSSPILEPSQMVLVLEGNVRGGSGIEQSVSLFNFDTNNFEAVDSRTASRIDNRIEVVLAGDVSRFVQPGTGAVEAEISYSGRADRQRFTANLDQFYWHVVE